MTFQTVLGACCAMFVLLGPAQAQLACATEAQRKIEIEKLNESVDWFLSIVEEVPESIARQFSGSARRDGIPSGICSSPMASTQNQRGWR
jgi:hypothetical protein